MIFILLFIIEKPVEPKINFKTNKKEEKEFNTLKFLFIKGIKFYQFALSGMQGDVCNFEPSCSNYAIEAIEKFNPFIGVILAADRFERCNPFTFNYAQKYYTLTFVKGRGIKVKEKPEDVMRYLIKY